MDEHETPAPAPEAPQGQVDVSQGLQPNQAGALSYVFGIITGVIMLIMDQRPFVRFHAFQCVALFAVGIGVGILLSIIGAALSVVPLLGALIGILLYFVLTIGGFVLWLMLMYRAYQGRAWELPLVGPWARRQAGL